MVQFWMPGHSLTDNNVRRPTVKTEQQARRFGNRKARAEQMARRFAKRLQGKR